MQRALSFRSLLFALLCAPEDGDEDGDGDWSGAHEMSNGQSNFGFFPLPRLARPGPALATSCTPRAWPR